MAINRAKIDMKKEFRYISKAQVLIAVLSQRTGYGIRSRIGGVRDS